MGNDLRGGARAADGFEIAVTRFAPTSRPWANVLVAPAMGVRQDFYAPFARFLAGEGVNALTFDYRGIGRSGGDRVARIDADVVDWARKDFAAAIAEAQRPAPHLPLALVGHSLGGQIFALAPGHESVSAVVNVAAGVGDYRLQRRVGLQVRLLWWVMVPLLTPLFGYFPGRKLRMVGDLPRGVARQWRRWCLHPDYLVSEGAWARDALAKARVPILSYSFEDDVYIGKQAVAHLNSFLTGARIEHRHIAPAEIGAEAIGHVGFFSERRREDLWREAVRWLRGQMCRAPAAREAARETAAPAQIREAAIGSSIQTPV